eukprot:GHVH01000842.1.p1 GENE.GHVH01000842.1~~GHVH01000842.1.p1  ORF type:complete len:414 (+),score=81.35 GHVH01000842.1:186-1427(+)
MRGERDRILKERQATRRARWEEKRTREERKQSEIGGTSGDTVMTDGRRSYSHSVDDAEDGDSGCRTPIPAPPGNTRVSRNRADWRKVVCDGPTDSEDEARSMSSREAKGVAALIKFFKREAPGSDIDTVIRNLPDMFDGPPGNKRLTLSEDEELDRSLDEDEEAELQALEVEEISFNSDDMDDLGSLDDEGYDHSSFSDPLKGRRQDETPIVKSDNAEILEIERHLRSKIIRAHQKLRKERNSKKKFTNDLSVLLEEVITRRPDVGSSSSSYESDYNEDNLGEESGEYEEDVDEECECGEEDDEQQLYLPPKSLLYMICELIEKEEPLTNDEMDKAGKSKSNDDNDAVQADSSAQKTNNKKTLIELLLKVANEELVRIEKYRQSLKAFREQLPRQKSDTTLQKEDVKDVQSSI